MVPLGSAHAVSTPLPIGSEHDGAGATVSKSRVEAFSDGVLAIAITLLVLDIPVPSPQAHWSLAHVLVHDWAHFAAYAVSFLTIGVIWVNHHAMLRRLASVDHTLLILNIVLLLFIALLPWSTALMASFLTASRGQHLAAAIYSGSFLAMSCVFYAMQRHALYAKSAELTPQLSDAARAAIARRNRAGLLPYAVATVAAPLSSYLTLAICAAIAIFYALPTTSSDAPSSPAP